MLTSINGTNKSLHRDMFKYLKNQISKQDQDIETLEETTEVEEALIEVNDF
jgi:hypothetical protein